MPTVCCVYGCSNTTANGPAKYFAVPTVRTREGEATKALTERRRRLWIQAINRQDLTDETVRRHHVVCSDHFISGKPAYMHKEHDPDWVPHLKLGYGDGAEGDPILAMRSRKGRKKPSRDPVQSSPDHGTQIPKSEPDEEATDLNHHSEFELDYDQSDDVKPIIVKQEPSYESYDLKPCSVKLERTDDLFMPEDRLKSPKLEMIMECETADSKSNFNECDSDNIESDNDMETCPYVIPSQQSEKVPPSSENVSANQETWGSSDEDAPGIQYYKTDDKIIESSAMNFLGTLSVKQLYLLMSIMSKEILRLQARLCNETFTEDQDNLPPQEFEVNLNTNPVGMEVMHNASNNRLFRGWLNSGKGKESLKSVQMQNTQSTTPIKEASDSGNQVHLTSALTAAPSQALETATHASHSKKDSKVYAFTCGHVCSVCTSGPASRDVVRKYGAVLPKVALVPAPDCNITSFEELHRCSLEMTNPNIDEDLLLGCKLNSEMREKILISRRKRKEKQKERRNKLAKGFSGDSGHRQHQGSDSSAGDKMDSNIPPSFPTDSDEDDEDVALQVHFGDLHSSDHSKFKVHNVMSLAKVKEGSVRVLNSGSYEHGAPTAIPTVIASTAKSLPQIQPKISTSSSHQDPKIHQNLFPASLKATSLSDHARKNKRVADGGPSIIGHSLEQSHHQPPGTSQHKSTIREEAVARIDALLRMAEGGGQPQRKRQYNVVVGNLNAKGVAEFRLQKGMPHSYNKKFKSSFS